MQSERIIWQWLDSQSRIAESSDSGALEFGARCFSQTTALTKICWVCRDEGSLPLQVPEGSFHFSWSGFPHWGFPFCPWLSMRNCSLGGWGWINDSEDISRQLWEVALASQEPLLQPLIAPGDLPPYIHISQLNSLGKSFWITFDFRFLLTLVRMISAFCSISERSCTVFTNKLAGRTLQNPLQSLGDMEAKWRSLTQGSGNADRVWAQGWRCIASERKGGDHPRDRLAHSQLCIGC